MVSSPFNTTGSSSHKNNKKKINEKFLFLSAAVSVVQKCVKKVISPDLTKDRIKTFDSDLKKKVLFYIRL